MRDLAVRPVCAFARELGAYCGAVALAALTNLSAAQPIPQLGYASDLVITEWLVAGPFDIPVDVDPWDAAMLAGIANEAAEFVPARIEELIATSFSASTEEKLLRWHTGEFVDFNQLFERPYVLSSPQVAYAMTNIVAPAAQTEAWLLLGSADSARVWLNGNELPAARAHRGLTTYDDALPLPLQPGGNLLVVKVPRWRIPWGLSARVVETAPVAADTVLRSRLEKMLLPSRIVSNAAVLEFAPKGVPSGVAMDVAIMCDRQVVAEFVVRTGEALLPNLPLGDGIYRLRVTFAGSTYEESFVIGDTLRLKEDLRARVGRLTLKESHRLDMDAQLRRLELLHASENRPERPERVPAWEMKVVYSLEELAETAGRIAEGGNPFRDRPGLHLRAFRSRLDNAVQHYRVYLPRGAKPHPAGWPLVVILPTAISANRPFLESPFVAAHSEAERMGALADRHGVALLWCGYRTQPCGNEAEYYHIHEALAATCAEYDIDRTRMSLMGACSAGAIATMTAARWPRRFAAIGLLNPMFGLLKQVSTETAVQFARSGSFREWLGQRDCVPHFLSACAMPVRIIHDGAEPGHGDLHASLAFVKHAQEFSRPVMLERNAQTLAQHFGAWDSLLQWLSHQQSSEPSDAPNPRLGYVAGEMRIVDFFGAPFVVVKGTGGTAAEVARTDEIAGEFETAWRKAHFGACRVTTDNDFLAGPTLAANVVLIGNPRTNRVWAQLVPESEVVLREGSIRLLDREWIGEGLAIQAVFEHPARDGRRVLVVGAANLLQARFGTMNLSVEGWYRAALWRGELGRPKVVWAGYY